MLAFWPNTSWAATIIPVDRPGVVPEITRRPFLPEAQTVSISHMERKPRPTRCFGREREAWLDGFTVSDIDTVKLDTGG
jgi:hypothetical protein